MADYCNDEILLGSVPAERNRQHATAYLSSQCVLDALSGQAKALVITDENDVLRDEGEAYAQKLIEAGVPTIATRYNGTIHDFVMLNALAQTPAARAAIAQANQFLRDALGER